MADPKPVQDYTQQNRRAWNEIAQARARTFPGPNYFAQGGSTLDERAVSAARAVFGDLNGLRVVHLQCATGEDTLSWSVLGAQAVGIDISEEQILLAQQKADQAGLNTRFQAADVFELPEALPQDLLNGRFDLVFTGGRAIVWLPDLDLWAQAVTSLLRPGGRFLLIDEHPLSGCLWLEEGQVKIIDDYFRRSNAWEGAGWFHFQGSEGARENKYEFNWPVGDVVSALARAGLVIERLEEFPGGPEWRFGKDQGEVVRLPGEYMVLARKPSKA